MSAVDFGGIREMLPHDHPMILIDRVLHLDPGRSLLAVKAVSGSEPCYADLAPGGAGWAYPASLLIESFGQAAALLWMRSMPQAGDAVPMFAAARDIHLAAPAYPGDVLCHAVTMEHANPGVALVSGHTSVQGRRIALYGSMTAVVRARDEVARVLGGSQLMAQKENDHG